MKKFGVFTLTFALTMALLQGCESTDSSHQSVNENVTITDAKVSKLDSYQSGKITVNKVFFEKDGKATEFDIDGYLYDDIDKILKTAKMVGKEKETTFDVVTDGEDVISVTLVSNRK